MSGAESRAGGSSTAQAPSRGALRRATVASSIGNGVEWFEYGIYGYVALTVGEVFFPEHAAFGTFGVLAVSFLLRPLGGLFFGWLGDRIGRQKTLIVTILSMAAATSTIGLLPTYASVGILSPALLLLCRLVQGFSAGGEYVGAMTFLGEYSEPHRRGRRVTWVEVGTYVGIAAGSSIAMATDTLLGRDAMLAWGWRLPFLVAGPIGIVGLLLRWKLEDTPVFRELVQTNEVSKAPIKDVLVYRKSLVYCAALAILVNGPGYILSTYTITYLQKSIGMTAQAAFFVLLAIFAFKAIAITRLGALSDRIGRKPVLIFASFAFIVLTYPVYLLISVGHILAVALGFLLFATFQILTSSVLTPTMPALFPSHVRFTGVGLSYNVFTAMFGGTAPFIVDFLIDTTGNNLSPAYYVIFCALITLIPILKMPETAGVSMRGRGIPEIVKKSR